MMPSNLPSSFASAAAGQNTNRDARSNSRSDARGASGDWSRSGRSSNGTLTFRRSSVTPSAASAAPQQIPEPTPPTPEVPTSANPIQSAFDVPSSGRYSKEQLLAIYKDSAGAGDVSELFMEGWNPGQTNGSAPQRWAKPSDSHPPLERDLCWNPSGNVNPIGLRQMTPEERDLFSTDVNSSMKPPQSKDGPHQGGLNGRKSSVSHGTGSHSLVSPSSATRPPPRRRETTDTNPYSAGGLTSPSASRYNRDDPSYWFGRSRTDTKEPTTTEEVEEEPASARDVPTRSFPFGSLSRSNTGGFATSSSLWGASSPSTAVGPTMGSFGNFALPSATSNAGEKPKFGRGESRLAHLMGSKESSENINKQAAEVGGSSSGTQSWRNRPRTDTDPFGSDDAAAGGGGLSRGQEASPPPIPQADLAQFDTPLKGSAADFGMAGLSLSDDKMPLSPSETNPFRSPPVNRDAEDEFEDPSAEKQAPGVPEHGAFGPLPRHFAHGLDGSDRSQTSSVGAKGYGGFGGLAGWPSVPGVGTPDRERAAFGAFGGGVFAPMDNMNSPGLGNLGGVFGAPGHVSGTGSLRGAGKLSSLFPAAMQAQMQSQDHQEGISDSLGDLRQANPLGAIGRAAPFGARETDSPIRTARGAFDGLFPPEGAKMQAPIGTQEPTAPGGTVTAQQTGTMPFGGAGSSGDTPPTQVQRVMVMPDRMRWVYLDPQGQTQGPFTGLEMNDWYKANFFSPDLRIKRIEDEDFEPLGHLIRRIGNSREPFLVPQVGIPHGPPTQPFSPNSSTGVIPPLPNAFPQFGRILPADEQNNLERRKQEEQMKMARQRDFMAQQQVLSKLQMSTNMSGSLHHHSSVHSLQSQPSFGSMTSPIGMPPQGPIGAPIPATNFFDVNAGGAPPQPAQQGMGASLNMILDESGQPLTLDDRQILAQFQASQTGPRMFGQQSTAPTNEAGLRSQLPRTDELEEDQMGFSARLRQFEGYRAQIDAEEAAHAAAAAAAASNVTDPAPSVGTEEAESAAISDPNSRPAPEPENVETIQTGLEELGQGTDAQPMTLTEQVQQAQAAKQVPQAQDPWAKSQPAGLPMPFPPPVQASTQIAAPTAQRIRSTVLEQYNRSQSQTPDMAVPTSATSQPPPLAPWAQKPAETHHKGPSLKEIQEAEARKAAKAEEAAAAARRAALEQEAAALREREKVAATTTGLPTTSTWGSAPSPVGGSAAAPSSAWTKPGAVKGTLSGMISASSASEKKKTLADIQREEEARKKRAQEVAVQSGSAPSAGKRYADLASKQGQAAVPGGAATVTGWSTVGAGGKVKIPTGPAAQTRVPSQPKPTPAPAPKAIPKPISKETKSSTGAAMDEFNKWLNRELVRGLNKGVDVDVFAATLMVLPEEQSIIADAVYASSTTMDGRHFAEEFIRRKKLADKGVVEKSGPSGADSSKNASTGGWSEVAKKGSHANTPKGGETDIGGVNFKVVAGRKKGKK